MTSTTYTALVVNGTVYGVGRTEKQARTDAAQWLAEHDRTIGEDEISFVELTERQAELTDDGIVDVAYLLTR